MTCYRPIDAYIAKGKTANGKQIITFTRPKGTYINDIKLPCGQCIGCRLTRSVIWATRCVHEQQMHDRNCFLTLTYDDKHLPNDRSLKHEHFQKFIRALRKKIYPKRVRYFMAGEYTDDWRPHYHAIIFGYDFPDKVRTLQNDIGNSYYISSQVSEVWKKGFHIITDTNFETAAYVARYCTKKITGDLADEHYNRHIVDIDDTTGEVKYMADVQLAPEYARMSNRPGIGREWFSKFKSDCYPSDYLIQDGRKLPIPKYYDKIFESEDEYNHAVIKQRRKTQAMLNAAENCDSRLRQREKCKIAQAESLKRNRI